jgi:cupin 2 domain-containing protein
MNNIFDLRTIDFSKNEEIIEILSQGKNIRIERIISSGQISLEDFWYDQSEHEFVIVLQGEAKILFENRDEQFLRQGDYLIIPPHKKHRVSYTSINPKCIWLAVFYD